MCGDNRKHVKPPHLLEGEGRLITVLVTEVIVHPEVRLSAQLVSGFTVWDALDYTTLRKRNEIKMYFYSLYYLGFFYCFDQLKYIFHCNNNNVE